MRAMPTASASATPTAPTSSSLAALPRIRDVAPIFGVRLRAASTPEPRAPHTPTDCLETLPFSQPDPRTVIPELEDPGCQDEAIVELRRLHEEMDRAVLAAYGWSDLQVVPFCPSSAEEQSALEAFQDQVIDRLFVLNAEQAAEEKRLGKGAGSRKKREPSDRSGGQGNLSAAPGDNRNASPNPVYSALQ